MKAVYWIALALVVGISSAWAAETDKHDHSKKETAAKASEPHALKQATCPVSGKPIKDDQFVEYEGKKIYFCCGDCPAKFKESPLKYLPAVYKQIYPQSVQVKCPVMGGDVDPGSFTDYKGRRVYFCCDACIKKFNDEPAKYLAKLKDCSTEQIHCPVMGERIDPTLSVEVGGKKVYVCCKVCIPKLKTDFAKYSDTLTPQAGVLARGETVDDDIVLCSVCLPKAGEHIRKDTKPLIHGGRTYFLSSEACVKEFKENPDKFIKALDAEMKKRSESQSAAGVAKP